MINIMMSLRVLALPFVFMNIIYKCISLIQIVTERISVFDFDEADQLSFTEFHDFFFNGLALPR